MPGWMKWAIALLIGAGIITAGWRLADSRWFFWVLPAFFVANCLVLIVVVLLQSGKARILLARSAVLAAKPLSALAALPTSSPKPPRGALSCSCSAPLPWCCARIRPLGRAIRSLNGFRSPRQSRHPRQLRPHPQRLLRRHLQHRNPTRSLPLSLRQLRSQFPRSRKNRSSIL